MSFYGNSYYYTAETFAKIYLKNSGLAKAILPAANDFPSKEVEINALHRQSGVRFDSGNQWIGFSVDESQPEIKIWHNKPADFGVLTTVGGLNLVNKAPDGVTPDAIDFNSCIQVPQITYDATGHITTPIGSRYFKMPVKPTAELETRMQKIDGYNAQGEEEEPSEGAPSLRVGLNTRMDGILERMSNIDGINTETGEFDPLKPSVQKQMNDLMNPEVENSVAWMYSKLSDKDKTIEKLDEVVLNGYYDQYTNWV
jgi:hypothetical protein